MIEKLLFWAEQHQGDLARNRIFLKLSQPSEGLPKDGISAVLTSDRFEATVELWENGESEFYFLDWEAADRDPNYQAKVTHYDFRNAIELLAALETLVSRMSPVLSVSQV